MSSVPPTHVLVKWATEEKWDVYPVRCIIETEIGHQLLYGKKNADNLRGTKVTVKWAEDKEPAPAILVESGT